MRKGQTKRVWIPEQKSEIVHKYWDDHISVRTLEREYTAGKSMICRLVTEYISEGEAAFVPMGHPGNPFTALHTSRSPSELERLRLIVAKLEIENERFKKGYCVEGAGANNVFATGPDNNTKSSKH